eukprot:g17360.t1
MGRFFRRFYSDEEPVYCCAACGAHLAQYKDLLSTNFRGRTGNALLFNQVINVTAGLEEPERKIYRPKSDALMEGTEAGKIQVHPSRQPIDKKKLSSAMNNVQRMLFDSSKAE